VILVVADTGPIHYLVLTETVDVLPQLYDRVVIPAAVNLELTHPNSPAAVRDWALALPPWCEIRVSAACGKASDLGPGEMEAIALAQELNADAVLLDDRAARREAIRCGLVVTGTLGVLVDASELDLIVLEDAFTRLSRTTFYADPVLIQQLLARESARRERPRDGSASA
jgi:predicted nucleic acid-binding protein